MTSTGKFLRPAPAYQEYAADMLADQRYRLMSLAERGLWDTLRKECWVNQKVPATPSLLAKLLGLEEPVLMLALTDNVLRFFQEVDGHFICPELTVYRDTIEDRRMRQSAGGGIGGKKTQSKIREVKANLQTKVRPLSREDSSRIESGRGESSIKVDIDKQWVDEYDKTAGPYN